jgi:hypothetical protein
MIDDRKIKEIVKTAADAHYGDDAVADILVEPTLDAQGNDALQITIVIATAAEPRLTGPTAVDLLLEINDQLSANGEPRTPIVYYATVDEMNEPDDNEEED